MVHQELTQTLLWQSTENHLGPISLHLTVLDILAVDFKICLKKTTNSQTNLCNIQKNLTVFDTLTHMYCRVYTLYHNHSDIFHTNRRLQL